MAKPLDITTDLCVSIAGNTLNVQADGRLITLALPNLQAGRELCKTWRSNHDRGNWFGGVMALLAHGDLQLEIQLRGRIIARLGVGVRPSLASWLLGLRPLELRPLQMILAIAHPNK